MTKRKRGRNVNQPAKLAPISSNIVHDHIDKKDGWLSPYGQLYVCESGGHDSWVEKHMSDEDKENRQTYESHDQVLERFGWIKLMRGSFGFPQRLRIDSSWPVTREQWTFVNDYSVYWGIKNIKPLGMVIVAA